MTTKVLVLAAGQGTRLRPLTDDRPKCLVPLLGKPLLERQREALAEVGLDDVTVAAGYRHDMIEALGFPIRMNPEFETTNMVSTLFCAEDILGHGGDVVITYGDVVFEPRVMRALLSCDAPIALVADMQWERYWRERMDDPLADAETFKTDGDGRVTELGKKAASLDEINGQYTGLIKFRADTVGAIREFYHRLDRSGTFDGKDFDNMYMTSFLQALIDAGVETRAVSVENGWLEVDSVEDLEIYERLEGEGKLGVYYGV